MKKSYKNSLQRMNESREHYKSLFSEHRTLKEQKGPNPGEAYQCMNLFTGEDESGTNQNQGWCVNTIIAPGPNLGNQFQDAGFGFYSMHSSLEDCLMSDNNGGNCNQEWTYDTYEPKFCCDFDATNFNPTVNGVNVNQAIMTNSDKCDNSLCEYSDEKTSIAPIKDKGKVMGKVKPPTKRKPIKMRENKNVTMTQSEGDEFCQMHGYDTMVSYNCNNGCTVVCQRGEEMKAIKQDKNKPMKKGLKENKKMKKNVIKIKESDITKLVKRIISEQNQPMSGYQKVSGIVCGASPGSFYENEMGNPTFVQNHANGLIRCNNDFCDPNDIGKTMKMFSLNDPTEYMIMTITDVSMPHTCNQGTPQACYSYDLNNSQCEGPGPGGCNLSTFETVMTPHLMNAPQQFINQLTLNWIQMFFNKYDNHPNGCRFLNKRLSIQEDKLSDLQAAGTNPQWQAMLTAKIAAIQAIIAECCDPS